MPTCLFSACVYLFIFCLCLPVCSLLVSTCLFSACVYLFVLCLCLPVCSLLVSTCLFSACVYLFVLYLYLHLYSILVPTMFILYLYLHFYSLLVPTCLLSTCTCLFIVYLFVLQEVDMIREQVQRLVSLSTWINVLPVSAALYYIFHMVTLLYPLSLFYYTRLCIKF